MRQRQFVSNNQDSAELTYIGLTDKGVVFRLILTKVKNQCAAAIIEEILKRSLVEATLESTGNTRYSRNYTLTFQQNYSRRIRLMFLSDLITID